LSDERQPPNLAGGGQYRIHAIRLENSAFDAGFLFGEDQGGNANRRSYYDDEAKGLQGSH
jgi:hypothetical protein